jgi:hypothetical protein
MSFNVADGQVLYNIRNKHAWYLNTRLFATGLKR